jgi:hypothetical protein
MPRKKTNFEDFNFELNGRTWRVEFVDSIEPGTVGLTYGVEGVIRVVDKFDDYGTKYVLWHELTHAMLEHVYDGAANEETVCNMVSQGLLQLFKQKRKLPKWLFGG